MKIWARRHNVCKKCGTTKYPHKALGFCKNCYDSSKGYIWQKNYKAKNTESIREYQRERAKKLYALGKWGNKRHKISLMKKLIERDGEYCKDCGTTTNLTIEHLIPRCVGGKNNLDNLTILCDKCNIKTYHKLVKKALLFYFKSNG